MTHGLDETLRQNPGWAAKLERMDQERSRELARLLRRRCPCGKRPSERYQLHGLCGRCFVIKRRRRLIELEMRRW